MKLSLQPAYLCLLLVSVVQASERAVSPKATFVKRTLQTNALRQLKENNEKPETFRRRHVSLLQGHDGHEHRKQVEDGKENDDFAKAKTCDKSLLICLPNSKCADCFRYLYNEAIDWGTVTPETSCQHVVEYLSKKNYCSDLNGDQEATDLFCNAFDACAVWDEDDDDMYNDGGGGGGNKNSTNGKGSSIDCNSLTECDWPGIHKSFLGDGICHDGIGGCYNTAVCNYDGGDCCEDTCQDSNYVECGHDGYVCRDPKSEKCDPKYSNNCEHGNNEVPDPNAPDPADTKCDEAQTKYRLVMYDSFGDGWDQTKLTITQPDKSSDPVFKGGLETGSVGTQYVCLAKESTCVHIDVSGGEWANEVSWEVKPMTEGAPALAGGGSPMSCDFSVGGSACDNTCTGKPNIAPNNDPHYKEFKDLYTCIENKCPIQVGACTRDLTCSHCLEEEKQDYCYGSQTFVALVDCTMCQCTDRKGSDYCASKLSPGKTGTDTNNNDRNNNGRMPDGSPRPCSSAETMKGSEAVLTFGSCTKFDQVEMLVTDYDQNHFGKLDNFESCAHSFSKEENHGGHTALGCMQILVNAMNSNLGDDDAAKEDNAESIAALADLLYHQAGTFCDCAAKASDSCPLCSSFVHVKTLLYESLDACQSLDEIDCDAWMEFHAPCKDKILSKFGSVDFNSDEQCSYVHDGCGGAGPFPAFRRLDCGAEIPKPAWDFYQEYSRACLKDDNQPLPVVPKPTSKPYDSPTNPPNPGPSPATPRPTLKPYYPPDGGDAKPYVAPDDDKVPYKSGSSDKKKSHFLRNFFIFSLICGAGFYYYKRRTDAFSFVRYRNTRNYAGGESEMYSAPYSGLTMDSGSNSFQPPSLPPTPSAIDGQYGYR